MIRRLLATSALLLLAPAAFWLSGWQWQGDDIPLQFTFWLITLTAGKPGAFVSIVALFALLHYAHHRRGENHALLLLVLISLGATQIGKSVLKPIFGEARPYVVALTDNDPARLHLFYSVPRAARANTVSYYYAQSPTPPPSYLVAHRASETGYSFPSGHSTFAATWALLFAGIIGFANRRRALISAVVIAWAMLVMASRVWLGMHYAIDLAGGILLACAINLPLLHLWQQRHQAPLLRDLLKRLRIWRK